MKKRFFRFFLVFFFAMMLAGCTFLADGTNKQREAAKNHVKTLLAVNYGDTIDDRVLEPVTQSFGIVIDESKLATEEDLANASYSGFLNGQVFARFESSNPEIMEPKWVSYKTRTYEKDASGKITGITVTEQRELRVIVNRPAEDTVVKLTTYAKAPYEINGVTYQYEAKRTIEFTVSAAEPVEESQKTIGEINALAMADWSAFESAKKLVDAEGNELVFQTHGVVTEVLWGDGYDNHSFMVSDGANSLYIYAPAAGSDVVEIGDYVEISGLKVTPYYGIIESVSKSASIKVLYGGQPVPQATAYTVDEWYALNREVHDAPGQRVKLTGLLVKDGDYKLKSETTDKFVTIYYKAYTAYEQSILEAHVGDVVEMETAIYDYHSSGYWRILPNVYDYPMTVIKAGEHPDQPDQPDQPDTPEVVTPVDNVEVGKQYKLYVNQVKAGKELYFAGVMDGNFFGTTEDAAAATLVTVEAAEGGYYLSFVDASGAKKYLDIYKNDSGKKAIGLVDAPTCVYVWNADVKTMFTTVESLSKTFYFGTYNTYTTISSSETSYVTGDNAANVDVSQFPMRFVAAEGAEPEQPSGPVDNVEVGKQYKLYVNQVKAGKELYFAGVMDGNFFGTTEDAAAATLVTVEAAEGGYYLSFVDASGAKKYLDIYKNDSGKKAIGLVDAPTCVYVWNADVKTMFTTVESLSKTFYFGTYNTYTTISSSETSYVTGDNAANVDVSQFPMRFIAVGGSNPQPSEATIVDFSFTTYFNDNNLANGAQPQFIMLDEVVKYEVDGTSNCGKLYKSDSGVAEARFYKSGSDKMIISVPEGVTLVKVTAVKGAKNYDDGAEVELEIVDNKVTVVASDANFNIKSLHVEYTGTPSGTTPDPEQPQEVTYITVAEAKAGSNNVEINVKGLVAGIYQRGFILEDNTGTILVYTNAVVSDLAIGDYVAVKGNKAVYPTGSSAHQIASPTYEKLTETPTYALAEAVVWTATEVDAAWEGVVAKTYDLAGPLVKMTVTMTSVGSYYNATVEGSEQVLSFAYPLETISAGLEVGKTYEVQVIPFSYSMKSGSPFYFNCMLLSAEEPSEPEVNYFLLDFEDHPTDGDCTDAHWAITKYANDGWQTITSVMMRYRGKDGTRVVNMACGYSTPYMYRYNLDEVVKGVNTASIKIGNYFSGAAVAPMKVVLVLEDDSLVYLMGDANNFYSFLVTTGLEPLSVTLPQNVNVKAFYIVIKSALSGGGYIYIDDVELKYAEPETPVQPEPDTLPMVLTFSSENMTSVSSYESQFTATLGSHTFVLAGINNNGGTWTELRANKKNLATTASISSDQINAVVSKVVLHVTACVDADIQKVQLIVYSDAAMTNAVTGSTLMNLTSEGFQPGDWTFNVPNPGTGLYYKIVIELKGTQSNGTFRFDSVTFQ